MTDDKTFHYMTAGERVCVRVCVSLSLLFYVLAFPYFKLGLGEFLFQNNNSKGKRLQSLIMISRCCPNPMLAPPNPTGCVGSEGRDGPPKGTMVRGNKNTGNLLVSLSDDVQSCVQRIRHKSFCR